MKRTVLITALVLIGFFARAQQIGASPEYVKALTSKWTGERFADGRPKVSDLVLEELAKTSQEDIWQFLVGKGYPRLIESDWLILKPGENMVGRVVTAQYMPSRPDLDTLVRAQAVKEGRTGGSNQWPINILTKGDVYVADGYGKIGAGSTLIGGSLGNAIYGKTGKGVIFNAGIRDAQQLKATPGFNAWVKGQDPSGIQDMLCTGINVPINVGRTTVLPGDIVFANEYGVTFIPAYIAVDLVTYFQMTVLQEEFEMVLGRSGKYTPEQVHGGFNDEIIKLYRAWFAEYSAAGKTKVTQAEFEATLKRSGYIK